MDVTRAKGPDTELGPTLITAERHIRIEVIMARMYGLKMLRHKTRGQPSNCSELDAVICQYPYNVHANVLLGIGPMFADPFWDDVPTDEDNLQTGSNVESNSEDEIELLHTGADNDMED